MRASHDPRNPKRKLAWSGTHNEIRFVSRPSAIMGQRKIVSHEVFTKCGESTNYSKGYTVVQNRTLEEIPRFTIDDKATSLGQVVICVFGRDRVQKDVDSKGHIFLERVETNILVHDTLQRLRGHRRC